MEELKVLYTKILSLTESLEYFIGKEDTKKIDDILAKRLEVVEFALQLKEEHGTSDELEELAKKIKSLDAKNYQALSDMKKKVEKDLFSITKNTKAVSAYKTPETKRSRLVNEKDI